MIDLETATLSLLVVIGTVNVITFFQPSMDSRMKFGISILVAFAVSFVPVELGSILLEKIKDAITVALAASGGYKLFTKAGGN